MTEELTEMEILKKRIDSLERTQNVLIDALNYLKMKMDTEKGFIVSVPKTEE